MAELVEAILKKDKDIDMKVSRMLARIRIWHCLRWLDRGLVEEADERRVRQRLVQHSRSRR